MNKYEFRPREPGKTFKLLKSLIKNKTEWKQASPNTLLIWYTNSKEAWEYEKNLYKESNEAAEELDKLIVEYLGDKE